MEHNDIDETNWNTDENVKIWEPYLKLDVASLGLVWASYLKSMSNVLKNQD